MSTTIMARWLFLLLAAAAVGLAGWAGYAAMFPCPQMPALTVPDMDRDLGDLSAGVSEITFHVVNISDRPSSIIGLAEG